MSRRLVVLLAVSVAAASAACTGGDDDTGGDGDTTTMAPLVAAEERATADEVPLAVGECGDVDALVVGVALDPATIVPVPCDQPHDVEVSAVFEYPAGPGLDYPGAAAVDGRAADECVDRFEAYVGRPYAESVLDVAFVSPSENGWDDGDRRLACVVYHTDFTPLTGSVAGTGA